MKTFKLFVLITGIIIGMIALMSSPVRANENDPKFEKDNISSLNLTELMELESILLDDYLQMNQLKNEAEYIEIVDMDNKTVYKGAKAEGDDLLEKSTFLFQYYNQVYYLVID